MAKTQITTAAEAASLVKDGMTVMVGGFMANGTPEPIIDELVKSNVKDLTIICNDAGFGRKKDKETGEWKGKARGVGKLVENGQVKKLIASHVGLNPEFGAKYFEGEIDLELVPQGTLAERIRCGGSGLGGFYTPTGVGTEVAEGKEIKTIDGVDYILELPLHADIALIGGHKADASGNLRYIGSERNFNPMMAMAADTVVAGVSEIVEAGQIGVGYLPQDASVFRKMSVEDNIVSVMEMKGMSKSERKEKLEALIDEFNLSKVRRSLGIQLSGGERRRCEIARALAIDPKFVLLDEPFAGVDPIAVEDIQYIIAKLKYRNIGVIITDHNVGETLAITDRAYLLYEGTILQEGTPAQLAADEDVRTKYLGSGFQLKRSVSVQRAKDDYEAMLRQKENK